jgi:hypothetical protein
MPKADALERKRSKVLIFNQPEFLEEIKERNNIKIEELIKKPGG